VKGKRKSAASGETTSTKKHKTTGEPTVIKSAMHVSPFSAIHLDAVVSHAS